MLVYFDINNNIIVIYGFVGVLVVVDLLSFNVAASHSRPLHVAFMCNLFFSFFV